MDKLIVDKNLTKIEIGVLHNFYGKYFVKIGDYNKGLESFFQCLEIDK